MDDNLKQRWVHALEGDYANKKGRGQLHFEEGSYCCLGVLADIEGKLDGFYLKGTDESSDFSPYNEDEGCSIYIGMDMFGLPEDKADYLMVLNDESDTFLPVIEYIKENV